MDPMPTDSLPRTILAWIFWFLSPAIVILGLILLISSLGGRFHSDNALGESANLLAWIRTEMLWLIGLAIATMILIGSKLDAIITELRLQRRQAPTPSATSLRVPMHPTQEARESAPLPLSAAAPAGQRPIQIAKATADAEHPETATRLLASDLTGLTEAEIAKAVSHADRERFRAATPPQRQPPRPRN